MCRIIGHLGGAVDSRHLRDAAMFQRAGGPDEQYLIVADAWALGANRLAIMHPEGGRQPYSLGDRIHVVFNGEIYNHRQLRADLAALGHEVRDGCDGAVLPALYEQYGLRFTEHLDGMYAIAVLDLRAEPTLVLATDHAGMKPLYYHLDESRGSLVFASEIQALLGLPGVPNEIWAPALESYLAVRTVFGDRTFFSGIRTLPPSTTMTFTACGGAVTHTRQAPVDRTGLAGPGPGSLSELLRAQVGQLGIADAPVCAVVSGGLDSSLVAALLAESVPELHSFTIAYTGEWPFDERPFAAAVAQRVGTTHHEVVVDPSELPGLLHDVTLRLGQPNADPITVSTYALFRAVRAAGFRVALTGDGADEVFLGYARTRAALTSTGDWRPGYLDALAAVPLAMRRRLYSSDYRDHVLGGAGFAMPPGSALDSITAFELTQRLPAYHLRRVDHLAMAHGVEARLPFCQRAVQEHALGLPQDARLAPGVTKRALRAAARGLLPDVVLDRPKQPFTLPITAMLSPGSPLLEFAKDVLTPEALARDGQLRPTAVRQLLRAQSERPSDTTALAVWALVSHQLWRDLVVSGFGIGQVAA